MKAGVPTVKKQWNDPELTVIATNDVQNKSNPAYNEKTIISSRPFPPQTSEIQIFFQKAPGGGLVGFATKSAYHS